MFRNAMDVENALLLGLDINTPTCGNIVGQATYVLGQVNDPSPNLSIE